MIKLTFPLNEEQRDSVHAGDYVLLSGEIYTARDAAHKLIFEMIKNNETLPFDLRNACIYYVGPTPAAPDQIIGSAGPTTSSRMDFYTPKMMEHGLTCMIGKGRRSDEVKKAIIKNHGVYFVACGGAGALLSHCIIKREMVAFENLLSEAVTRLTIKDFPCFVGIDTKGNDIYDSD
ncbi:MAG: TRZ/ATZ family protein [Erysipelotrichia bacterium]|nr:TRZ/ATZ family protein [Erysipelotrichia bacterium]